MTKPTKWPLRPAKTQISLGICPVWSVFAVRSMGSWGPNGSSCGQRRLWSDWADGLTVILLVLSWGSSNGVEGQIAENYLTRIQLEWSKSHLPQQHYDWISVIYSKETVVTIKQNTEKKKQVTLLENFLNNYFLRWHQLRWMFIFDTIKWARSCENVS